MIALIRLLKPLKYYQEKYDTPLWGFNKLFLLMEKQHNRGQDGAGIGAVKIGVPSGAPYMFRERNVEPNALSKVFGEQLEIYNEKVRKGVIFPEFPDTVKANFDYEAEVLMGHLRYGSKGSYGKISCPPFIRKSTWPARNLMLIGNFDITNADELCDELVNFGIHPIHNTNSRVALEEITYHLDIEHGEIYRELRNEGVSGAKILQMMNERLNPLRIVSNAAKDWDGGYAIAGAIGNGDCFVLRDANGIRPCFYYRNDEIIAFASERVSLMTVFEASAEDVKEVAPGSVYIVRRDGSCEEREYRKAGEKTACSFERLYFSRGNDPEIYQERKALGASLCEKVCNSINNDFKNSVFSYIPNTAEMAYYGMMSEMRKIRRRQVKATLEDVVAKKGEITSELLDSLIMDNWPRCEKIAHKDIKMRTFISNEKDRMTLASHVYDITYGVVKPTDNLVCLDDSIVRGTTLNQQILRILGRTNPKKIIIASTAPQVRYPDCYGIDMSELGKFIAFQAAIKLTKERGNKELIREVYQKCIAQRNKPDCELVNYVKEIYDQFTDDEITKKIVEMVYPTKGEWRGELDIVFQTIEDLHKAVPTCSGDWFFSGKFPTPGGYKVLNNAYINYYENKESSRD
ncbi:MAG: amidophosphoribosyltransferase [Verrucomicrobiaceae bacterium]|nr:amidophosphoribosyltransferase [Verrucomicrobiaceae bacterium]